MKQYLIDTFRFNDWAQKRLFAVARELPDRTEVNKIFSHIISAQDKWLRRVKGDSGEAGMSWWDTIGENELEDRWTTSLTEWIEYLSKLDTDVESKVEYNAGPDDNGSSQSLRDIVLQLNYHAILHRAEAGLRIRDQGLAAPPTDYIYYLPPGNSDHAKAAG